MLGQKKLNWNKVQTVHQGAQHLKHVFKKLEYKYNFTQNLAIL